MSERVRLNKFLAQAGVASRRGADEMILARRVRVNGETVEAPGVTVDPLRDRVELDGSDVGAAQAHRYLLLHKPVGYLTTARDPGGRRTVLDLVPGPAPRLFPVGRLDLESEGLLFLMNDGRLAFRLTHPRYEVPKTYRVELDRPMTAEVIDRLGRGVSLEDGPTAPARVARRGGRADEIEITIHEGRNRQVRRMMDAVGFEVRRLTRIRFGPIPLGSLPPGSSRDLTPVEVTSLRKLVGLTDD